METTVNFYNGVYAINVEGKLENPTVEQLTRMTTLTYSIAADPIININPALVVLLGLDPVTKVTVTHAGALNKFVIVSDDGKLNPCVTIDRPAIMAAWLASGAPLIWDGNMPAPEIVAENRKQFARDAAGRFAKL